MVGTMHLRMRFFKGGGTPSPPKPPPPPAPSSAAENVRRTDQFRRRLAAFGYKETILTSPQGVGGMSSQNQLKTILGG